MLPNGSNVFPMTTTDLPTYDAALTYQLRLVSRSLLGATEVHEIAESVERPEYGSVWVRCSCGEHVKFKADDAERGERLYVQHVAFSLRARLAVAA